jgi:predicted transcriptional regulator
MSDHVPADAGSSLDGTSLSRVHAALADTRRRLAIGYVRDHRSMSLATLADGVAERAADVPLRDLDDETVAEVYFSLYHCHVPRLEDLGLVAYDQEADWVTRRETELWTPVSTLLDAAGPVSSDDRG